MPIQVFLIQFLDTKNLEISVYAFCNPTLPVTISMPLNSYKKKKKNAVSFNVFSFSPSPTVPYIKQLEDCSFPGLYQVYARNLNSLFSVFSLLRLYIQSSGIRISIQNMNNDNYLL